jgi:ATP-dependent RNA helicase HrpB
VKLASGAGAVIADESGVRDGEFIVALDVHAGDTRDRPNRPGAHLPRIRMATRVERDWLMPTVSEIVHRFDESARTARAARVDRYDALVLSERPVPVDPDIAAPLLADAWLARGPLEDDARLLRRLRFAGHDPVVEDLIRRAAVAVRTLDDVELARAIDPALIRQLDRDAPESIEVPSGRRIRLEYNEDGTVTASVKLQELFGLAETPRIGRRREPILLALLAPNGRPVQMTRDLRSFWDRTYPEVRKELRGRYPKHPWPQDPWTAPATHRTKKV